MSVINVNLEDTYTCKTDNQPIRIQTEIGDGQNGSSSVFLATDPKDPPNLGTKQDVAGKKATVVTTITDTLDETNWTSVTIYVVEGSDQTQYGPYKKQVTADLDTVIYSLQLHFS